MWEQAIVPEQFPTHRLDPSFWEALGRAVGSFGFLEEVLGKAIFAITSCQPVGDNPEQALEDWGKVLERALTDTLDPLATAFQAAAKRHQYSDMEAVTSLADDIRKAAVVRNALCHGSWYEINSVSARPLYADKKRGLFETDVDIEYLAQLQRHAASLAVDVITVVRAMGLPFMERPA